MIGRSWVRLRRRLRRLLFGRADRLFVAGIGAGRFAGRDRALLYYKTEPITDRFAATKYRHTNNWEIMEMVSILTRHGLVVDVVDRDHDSFQPEDRYDLFIGIGSGNSGRRYGAYASALPRAMKVLLATGPMPSTSDRLVNARYDYFNARHGTNVPAMRTYPNLMFDSFVPFVDRFLVIGEPDQFCASTYQPLDKPLLSYLPSISPEVRFKRSWLSTRRRTSFLCFAGDGFICKGVDLVTEAFLRMPEFDLRICGPASEKGFFDVLGDRISASPNIRYEGFVRIGSERFEQLIGDASFVVFAGSSEGCATSVASVMRAGLVPIVTPQTGISTGSFGFSLSARNEGLIAAIEESAHLAANLGRSEYVDRSMATLVDSAKYSQESFTMTFTVAIRRLISDLARSGA